MLDSEVKVKTRKGAHYPSKHNRDIQPLKEFQKELSNRYLTEEEIKLNLMLSSLLDHINSRMNSFDGDNGLGSKLSQSECKKTFIMPMVRTFEENIFSLSRSSYVQYVPLLLIAHTNVENKPFAQRIARIFTE